MEKRSWLPISGTGGSVSVCGNVFLSWLYVMCVCVNIVELSWLPGQKAMEVCVCVETSLSRDYTLWDGEAGREMAFVAPPTVGMGKRECIWDPLPLVAVYPGAGHLVALCQGEGWVDQEKRSWLATCLGEDVCLSWNASLSVGRVGAEKRSWLPVLCVGESCVFMGTPPSCSCSPGVREEAGVEKYSWHPRLWGVNVIVCGNASLS